MSRTVPLPVINLAEARFECTFGRGCEGLCCQDGRPPLFLDEVRRINANLKRILPRMRPEAQAVLNKKGYLDGRSEPDRPLLRVVNKWCIFFNKGCILHVLGAEEGDHNKYKPRECAWFPLWHDKKGNWFVRQKGYQKEPWDLFCLDPAISKRPAAETVQGEIAVVERHLAEKARTPQGRKKRQPASPQKG